MLTILTKAHHNSIEEVTEKQGWLNLLGKDCVISQYFFEHLSNILTHAIHEGFDAIEAKHVDLWRHQSFYRVDSGFSTEYKIVFAKTDKPTNIFRVEEPYVVLRYSYSSYEKITEQHRLNGVDVTERGKLQLGKLPVGYYPARMIPPDHFIIAQPVELDYSNLKNKTKVTIVGMIYRDPQYLDFMMNGIRKYGTSSNYEVDYLIVANDATPEILDMLKSQNINYTDYRDPKPDDYYLNRVYRAWNYGGMHASGDIVVFINSDMAFSPGWLDCLLDKLTPDTIPCSRLIESGKLGSGFFTGVMIQNCGRSPAEYNETMFFASVDHLKTNKAEPGGLFMPCAFYKKDFIESGGYPEGNVGSISGDVYFFYQNELMKKKKHITVFDSIVYHIQEGEKG